MALRLEASAHVCLLSDDTEEQKQAVIQFLEDGLDANEAILHISDIREWDAWLRDLQTHGIDVRGALDSRQLRIVDSSDWYVPGQRSSVQIARKFWLAIQSALQEYEAVRLVSNMAWTTTSAMNPEQLCHWEATKNFTLQDAPVRCICKFSLNTHSVPELHAVLRTHPLVLLDGRLVANPFNEADEILRREPDFNMLDDNPETLAQRLTQLRALP